MYIDSHKYDSFPVVAICTTKFDCSFVVYNLGKKWDAFYNLKDTQTDVSYINQLPTNPPKRICYIFDWIVKLTDQEEISISSIPSSVIEINSRTSFFAVSALTCGLHIVIYF
jgi:hypothetical protein